MQPISKYVRPFRWFWIAILYAATISLISGVQTWQHYRTFQDVGFASRDNASWLSKLISFSSMPGALPAYVVSAFSHSIALVMFIFLMAMLLVYGAIGLLIDLLVGSIRCWRSARSTSTKRECP